jgi:hypothetical protein
MANVNFQRADDITFVDSPKYDGHYVGVEAGVPYTARSGVAGEHEGVEEGEGGEGHLGEVYRGDGEEEWRREFEAAFPNCAELLPAVQGEPEGGGV